MAKKTHLKVRLVPENNPDSKFIYYAKKRTKVEKHKESDYILTPINRVHLIFLV